MLSLIELAVVAAVAIAANEFIAPMLGM